MDNINEICKQAIEHFGEMPQKAKAAEKLSELVAELMRDVNDDHADRESVIDRIADCNIMLRQLTIMYGEGNVLMRTYEKASRLANRIKEELAIQLE